MDVKGGVAMMVSALIQMRAEGTEPAGDVLLAIVADEEAGSHVGAATLSIITPSYSTASPTQWARTAGVRAARRRCALPPDHRGREARRHTAPSRSGRNPGADDDDGFHRCSPVPKARNHLLRTAAD